MTLMEQDFHVLAIDLPGFGKSEKSKRFFYSYQNYASLIVTLMKRLDLQSVVLVGHSMGGQIALHVAKQAPKLVEKLVLIGSSSYLQRMKRSFIYSSYLPFVSWWIKRQFKKNDVEQNLKSVVYNEELIDRALVEAYRKPFEDRYFLDGLIRLMRHREGDLPSSELNTIYHPTLLIWGAEDRVIPLHLGKRLLNDLPCASLRIYEQTGHLICEEKPTQVYEDIFKFIKKNVEKDA